MLDEPFTALDRAAWRNSKRTWPAHCERGGVVVLTTHHSLQHTPATYRDLDLGQYAA